MSQIKKLHRRYSLINVLTVAVVSLAVLAFVGLYFIWVFERVESFENQVDHLRGDYIKKQETRLQRELTGAIDYIEFSKSQIEKRVQQSLENRVHGAWEVADHLYQLNKGELSDEEIISRIKESLRPIRFNNDRGYYFATRYDGIELLFSDRPEMEGLNFLNIQDARGVFIIQEMLDLVAKQGSGFYEYRWTKPGQVDKTYRKISYIKGHEGLSFFIGAGEYLDDMEQDVKTEVLNRISKIKFGRDGYIFVLNKNDSLIHSHPNPKLVGSFMKDWEDKSIFQQIQNVIDKNGVGTVRYLWPKAESNNFGEKLSYIMQFEEWGWVLGAGYHLDEFENQIIAKRKELQDELSAAFLKGAIVIFCMIILMGLLCRSVALKIKENLDLFNTFFQRSATEASKIAEDKVVFKEFDLIARSANEMIDERLRIVKETDELHKQLQQSQKFEAIGTLAGGIAHDFNNLLTSIVGNTSLLAIKLGKNDSRYKHVEALEEAAQRGRDLVAQILTFGRKSPNIKETISLGEIVDNSLSLLAVTFPPTVKIDKTIPKEPCFVKADATQLQQIIMNLCTNATQAFSGQTGTIHISIEKCTTESLPLSIMRALDCHSVAVMKVQDDGAGMTTEVMTHIFDPFFSTKEVGEGTGLGLSVIHTIVERHGGFIDVHSVVDEGTVFTVYLPITISENFPKKKEKAVYQKGIGSVLLVDDEPLILHTIGQVLEEFGYSVITKNSAKDALSFLREGDAEVDLILTDQIMPEASGLELIEEVQKLHYNIPCILCTGYSSKVDEKLALAAGCSAFLTKPMDLALLSTTVARLIDKK